MHAGIVEDHVEEWGSNDQIVLTASFTPGSCSLTAYSVTKEGLEWGKKNRNVAGGIANAQGYNGACFEKVQMLLSDRFLGFFMVPENGSWNYNFHGVKHSKSMGYGLKLSNPLPYYHESHRPQHFLSFAQMEGEKKSDKGGGTDVENFFE